MKTKLDSQQVTVSSFDVLCYCVCQFTHFFKILHSSQTKFITLAQVICSNSMLMMGGTAKMLHGFGVVSICHANHTQFVFNIARQSPTGCLKHSRNFIQGLKNKILIEKVLQNLCNRLSGTFLTKS